VNFLQLEQGGNLLLNGGGYLLLNSSTPTPDDTRGGGGVSYQDIERYLKFIEDMKKVGQKPTPEIIKEIKNIVEDVPLDLPKLAAITVEADFSGIAEELQRIQLYIDRLQLFINRAIMEKNNEEDRVILALLM